MATEAELRSQRDELLQRISQAELSIAQGDKRVQIADIDSLTKRIEAIDRELTRAAGSRRRQYRIYANKGL